MSKKILLATDKPFAAEAVKGIRSIVEAQSGYQLELLESYTDASQLVEAAKTADAMIIRSDKVTAEVINAASQLKIVVRAGAGYDNIDLAAANAKGVVAMNTPGQNSNAVAELAFGLMLQLARVHYSGKAGTELKGKKIGIHAYGNVGRLVAGIAKGFGMEVWAFDPFVKKEAIEADGVKVVDKVEDLYANCAYVSLHIPATKETKESINYALLSRMPKGAALINTARAEVIHEADMVKLLAERTDLMYASDVAPSNAAEMQAQFGTRVFFTAKKLGAQTNEANVNAGLAAARQIIAFFEKGDTTFQVNK